MQDLDHQHCAECDYDLTGLPDRGRCPECGAYYSLISGEGVQRVDITQRRVDRLMGRLRTIGLGVAAAGIFILSLVIAIAKKKLTGSATPLGASAILWTGGFISLIFLVAAITSYVYEKPEP